MVQRKIRVLAFYFWFALISTWGCQSAKRESIRPTAQVAVWRPFNVIVVTIDTLRADRLKCYGYSKIETPNLDRLANRGVLFENAVAQVPITPPSHASIFTGTYPTVHQVRNVGGFSLDASHPTLAKILQQKGWQTAAILGSAVLARTTGLNQGFQTYDDNMHGTEIGGNSPQRRAGEVVDRAIRWLEQQSDGKPFLLWVHLYDPHSPYEPPSPFKEEYADRPYDGEIAYTDKELGRFLEAVERKSPPERTLLTVISDHGEGLSEHGEYSHGVFIYDSTIRIPWILVGPGVPVGVRIKEQVRTIDLLPTLLALLGGETPTACQGVILVPAFTGQHVRTTYSYAESLIPKIDMGWAELRGMRTSKWKYIRAPRSELYDLENDPQEMANVIQRYPAEAQKLENQLNELTSTGPGKPAELVRSQTISAETEEQLRSLGYVAAGVAHSFELTGQGVDPKDRVHILKLLDEATTSQKKTSPTQRIQILRQALKEDPTNSMIYFLLGEGYEVNQRDNEALEIYQSAIRHQINGASRIYFRMGKVYGRHGKMDAAIASFEKAMELDPSDIEIQNKLSVAYLLSGRNGQAERLLKSMLLLNDENAQAHNSMGWIALNKKDPRTARQHFDRALQLDPDLMEAYINLGMLYKDEGDYDRARSCFETFLVRATSSEYKDSIPKVSKELATVIRQQQLAKSQAR